MKKMSETIVFFGSGPVAAASLALLARDFHIEAVVTKPQPSHHKESFPVLELAKQLNLKTLATSHESELSAALGQHSITSRLGVVIDYGIIIPETVIKSFEPGIVNSHFSLLPRWRGADPISFSILNGDTETGVSLMLIVEALDEGPLLDQANLPIKSDATTPQLTDELVGLSHKLLVKNLPLYLNGSLTPRPQPAAGVTYSRKLEKSDSILNFTKTAAELEREVRAFAGWPRSRTKIGDIDVIITAAHVESGRGQPGQLYRENRQLGFYTTHDILIVDKLIPAGKKEMPTQAFMAGYLKN